MDDPNEITIASFLRSRESMNRSERTIQSYEESLLQLEEWLDGNDLLDAEKSDIEDWMAHLLREHAATTAGVRFRSVRAFYNWAVGEELITRSPMVKMKEPKPDDLPVPIVPDDHLQTLIKACEASGKHDFEGVRDVALIRMFCEPGSPRVAEMAGALLEGVSVGRRAGYEVMGKGRKARWLPLGTRAATALGRYLILRAKRPGAHLPQLWLSAKRKREPLPLSPSGIQQMLERRAKAAGLPHIRAHQLRHTAAHWWKKSGGSEEDAEYLFGWTEGSRMVKRYAKSAGEERAQEAAKRMSIGDRL